MRIYRAFAWVFSMLALSPAAFPQFIPPDVPVPVKPHIWGQATYGDQVVLVKVYQTSNKDWVILRDFWSDREVLRFELGRFANPKDLDAVIDSLITAWGGHRLQSVPRRPASGDTGGSRATAVTEEPVRWVYVATEGGSNSLDILHPVTFALAGSIPVEPHLFGGIAFSPRRDRLYVTLWRSTTATPPIPAQIAVIDTEKNQLVRRIALTPEMLPSAPVVSKDGRLLYFADGAEGLVVVDLDAGSILERIPASRAGGTNNRFAAVSMSPDGALICVTDAFGFATLDTRTHTFTARVNITLPNRSIAPVFDPTGSILYLIDRRTVSGALAVSLVAFDTAELTEVSRVALPSTFDPSHLLMMPDGLTLVMSGFIRDANQPAKGGFLAVDATTNRVIVNDVSTEPNVGPLGVIVR